MCCVTADEAEFRDILAPFLAETLGNLKHRILHDYPDIRTQPAQWFQMWDEVRESVERDGVYLFVCLFALMGPSVSSRGMCEDTVREHVPTAPFFSISDHAARCICLLSPGGQEGGGCA